MFAESDKEFFDYNFFIINSENYKYQSSRLYGYALFENNIYINGVVKNIPSNADGAFINIDCQERKIKIQQDCNGSFGLYLYKNKDFFALSNSFLYLQEYLKNKGVILSLNVDYAQYFMTDELASMSVSETLIKEINLLPADVYVEIDSSGIIHLHKNIKNFRSVALNSKEGVEILDAWYHKWQNIVINLQKNNENIMVDLSGGMDSRATFSIFNSNEIDLSRILVNSATGELHTHKEDYEIASNIADIMGFKLNQRLNLPSYPIATETAMRMSFLAKLGIHKQMYFKQRYTPDRLFYFTGYGGESIRSHWEYSAESFIRRRMEYDKFITIDCRPSIKKIISKSISDIQERYDSKNDITLMRWLYRNTRLRSHFGKNIVENFLGNGFCLNPLMDRELQKIHTNDDTLLCIIYERYLQKIRNVKFDRNRKLDNKYIQKAIAINKKFPYISNNKHESNNIVLGQIVKPSISQENLAPRQKMREIFDSNGVRQIITDLFGYEVYQRATINWNRGGFFPDLLACSLLAIAKAKDCEHHDLFDVSNNTHIDIDAYKLILEVLNFFKTARIDIKFVGKGNYLKWSETPPNFNITQPQWFQNEGSGYVIENNNLFIKISVICIGNGDLKISLKGIDSRDDKKIKFPNWINFFSCEIDGIEKLPHAVQVHHDKPYHITYSVKNEQTVTLIFRWQPYGYNKAEFLDMVNKAFDFLPFNTKK